MEARDIKKANDERWKIISQLVENLHPLEAKFGQEPKIEPTEQWHWH